MRLDCVQMDMKLLVDLIRRLNGLESLCSNVRDVQKKAKMRAADSKI